MQMFFVSDVSLGISDTPGSDPPHLMVTNIVLALILVFRKAR